MCRMEQWLGRSWGSTLRLAAGAFLFRNLVALFLLQVSMVLGAPFRVIDEVACSGEADSEWPSARVGELSQKAMCLYAHIMLESVDLARELLNDPLKFDTDVPKVHEPQVQSLITSYCFAPKLAHLARVFPPFVVRDHLQKLERLQVQVYDELTGCKMDGILRKRAILPRRFGRGCPWCLAGC